MKKKMKTCAFTGHRPQNLPFGFNEEDERCIDLKKTLREQIINLIENEGVTHFISGMAIGVDMYAAETLIQTHYSPDCMDKRNRYMVDHADVLIAVWDGSPSGTGKTVRYAHQQGKSVITINPRTLCIEQQ